MEKAVLVSVLLCTLLKVATGSGSVCEGTWKIDKIEKCENPEQYVMGMNILKRKLDRNTDCFSLDIEFPEDFGLEYMLRMESFEKCDGGYKLSDVLSGGACDMVNQFAKENFQEILGAAGVEPRDCPIAKGKYNIKNYVIDYTKLPEQGKCGDHRWDVYLEKNGQIEGCVRGYSTFTAKDDDEDDK